MVSPVALFGKIAVGMEVDVTLEEPLTGTFKARVTVVDRVVDPVSSTLGIRLEMPNPNYEIPAGIKCQVRF